MKRCPKCLLPHEVPTAAQLLDEDAILTTQIVLSADGEQSRWDLGRAWLGFALRALDYCDGCLQAKGLVIAGEVAMVSLDVKSPEQIERSVDGGADVLQLFRKTPPRGWVRGIVRNGDRISNHELFRGATDYCPSPNDDGMPKRGA